MSAHARCRRWLVSRLQRTVCFVVLYVMLSLVIFLTFAPDPPTAFVEGKHRLNYPLIFLSASAEPFSDAAGVQVFKSRRCGPCFITNNKGFLPLSEYDAILVHGERDLMSEAAAFMDPGKRYLIETTEECVRNKLQCGLEPTVTSFSSRQEYTLCSLCDQLIQDNKHVIYSKMLYFEDAFLIL